MKVGIIGAGGIAVTMAKTLNEMEDATAYAVASRDLAKAQAFAEKNQIEKAYGSYEELFADLEVELVYVATPHSHHYQYMKMALEAGKPVLQKALRQTPHRRRRFSGFPRKKDLLVAGNVDASSIQSHD